MKIKYNARNVGAAALGCAMIAGTVCAGEETVSPSIASLTNMQILSLRQTKVFYHIIVISIFLKLVVHLNYIYLMLVACG